MQTTAEILKKHSPENLDSRVLKLVEELVLHSQKLEFRVHYLERYYFGRRSEKYVDPNQGSFGFDEVEACEAEIQTSDDEPSDAKDADDKEDSPRKSKRRRPQLEIPESIKRETTVHELSEDERVCECCGKIKAEIGEEVTEKLHVVPASLLAKRHIFKKYACRNKTCDQVPVQSPRDPVAIPKIKASEELLAFIAEQKYGYGMPLYRLEKMFSEDGVKISRYVMSLWMILLAEALRPLYEYMKKRLRASSYVHMDETVLQVLKEPERPPTSESRMWVMTSDLRSGSPPVAIFHYSPTRSASVIHELLGGEFRGYLQSDDYAGYGCYVKNHRDVVHVLCWDHARRKFWDAYQGIRKDKRHNSTADQVLKLIGKLYKVEERAKDLTVEDVLKLRTQESVAILIKIKKLVEEKQATLSESSPTYKAISYLLSNWELLLLYTTDGRLNISNNPAEQRIRPFAVGRKAWLFSNSPRGAEASAIIYSIVETAKLNGRSAGEYICEVLKSLATLDSSRIGELLPSKMN